MAAEGLMWTLLYIKYKILQTRENVNRRKKNYVQGKINNHIFKFDSLRPK